MEVRVFEGSQPRVVQKQTHHPRTEARAEAAKKASDFFQRMDAFMRFTGLPLVFFCIALNVWVVWTYVQTVIPLIARVASHPAIPRAHMTCTAYIVLNIAFNYAACVTVDAGRAPDAHSEPASSYRFRRCAKCSSWKDARTHHCSVCRRCVRRMDHHCPWFARCIGWQNYRYYLLYTAYTWIGVGYGAVSAAVLLAITRREPDNAAVEQNGLIVATEKNVLSAGELATVRSRVYANEKHVISLEEFKALLAILILCVVIVVALGVLLSWHVQLLCNGMTTIESFAAESASRRNSARSLPRAWPSGPVEPSCSSTMRVSSIKCPHAYNRGIRKNIEAVFGPRRMIWTAVLPSITPLPNTFDFPPGCDTDSII